MSLYIQTPRFVIREFKPEEQYLFLSLFDNARVTLHLPKRTKRENIQIFRTALTDYAANKPLGRWGIFNNGDGDFIGICLLRSFYNQEGKVELGYVLNQKYWGNGIASEMAQVVIGYGFTNTDAREIVAVTTLGNTASQKVLTKAGMKRGENFIRDEEELAYFSILR